eukprot:2519174-Pyramimonas_sp.AAC.1
MGLRTRRSNRWRALLAPELGWALEEGNRKRRTKRNEKRSAPYARRFGGEGRGRNLLAHDWSVVRIYLRFLRPIGQATLETPAA